MLYLPNLSALACGKQHFLALFCNIPGQRCRNR